MSARGAERAQVPARVGFDWVAGFPFILVHVLAVVGVVRMGFSWKGVAICAVLYVARMFGVTAGYHRYFAHKTFKTSRAVQLGFALLAMSSTQKGVLWWAGHHRVHHKFSDQAGDIHSVRLNGFWWSHVAWILSHDHDATDMEGIKDFARYPELVWLNKWHWVPSILLGAALFVAGGWTGLVWGYFVSTVLVWHGTFTINSLAHVFGRRRYATTDDSKNSLLLALITMGEGWHNNHHFYPRSVRQGFYWWEIDMTYYILRALGAVGLVWDLHLPPAKIRDRRVTRAVRTPAARAAATATAAAAVVTQPAEAVV